MAASLPTNPFICPNISPLMASVPKNTPHTEMIIINKGGNENMV